MLIIIPWQVFLGQSEARITMVYEPIYHTYGLNSKWLPNSKLIYHRVGIYNEKNSYPPQPLALGDMSLSHCM